MKARLPIVAIVVAAALALAGCSGGGGGGGGGGNTSPPKPNNRAQAKTYTENDLVQILTTANASLSAGGTVTDLGLVSSYDDNSGDLYQQLLAKGGSLTPTSCGTLLDKIGTDASTLGNNTGAYAAKLEFLPKLIDAVSSAKSIDVTAFNTLLNDDLTALVAQCSTMNVTLPGVASTFTFAKETISTDATSTYAYSEHATINGVPLTYVVILALDGNLFIAFHGLNGVAIADGIPAINAVVAAAK